MNRYQKKLILRTNTAVPDMDLHCVLRYPCIQLLGALMVLCFINQCLNYKQHYTNVHNNSTVTVRTKDIVELQWLEHLWDHENMFETGVVRANED